MCLYIVNNGLKAIREMKRNWNNFIKFVEIVHYNHFVIMGDVNKTQRFLHFDIYYSFGISWN